MPVGFGRFDDLIADRSLVFPAPHRILVAPAPDDVTPVLQQVSDLTAAGAWAYGYVGYEAAAGLDPLLTVNSPGPGAPPLAWFALSDAPTVGPAITAASADATWQQGWQADSYDGAVGAVLAHIAAGETYQVNLTSRLLGSVPNPDVLYASLLHQQRGAHGAYLDLGSHAVASASPELFFSWDGRRIVTRPMKGTARRGRTTHEDLAAREALLASEKERAEHVIVVDLLRNDLGRIAEFGSVTTPQLGVAERYESVWQLTSDVVAQTRSDVTLVDIFRALFPCGSITGAPKRRTMEIIADLEAEPRGVYCGAIGVVAPPGATEPRARFNVAIRTAVVERATGTAGYGVGGGITSGSVAVAERQELQAKSAILFGAMEVFQLFETMLHTPAGSIRNRELHLARLTDSAGYFGFAMHLDEIDQALTSITATTAKRVRLTLARDGSFTLEHSALQPASDRAVRLVVDTSRVDSSQRWLFHKTTRRTVYEDAAARHPQADDVVLVNESGCVTETTIASLVARIDGVWWTPPIEAGCLPGVERGRLIASGELSVRDLTIADLEAAEELAVVSSLRGWRPAVLVETPASRSTPNPALS